MADRIVRFILAGDSRGAVRAMEATDVAAGKTDKALTETGVKSEETAGKFELLGRATHRMRSAVLGLAGLAGLGALGFGIKDAIEGASKMQQSQMQLQQALKSTKQYSAQTAKSITDVAEASSTHGGFAATDQIASIATLTRQTGSYTKAVKLNNEITNVARLLQVNYATAQGYVRRAQAGTTGRLQQYIGVLLPVTKYTEGWTAAEKRAYPAVYRHQEALNKLATATEANRRIQQKFAGGTAGYNHTAAGAISNLRNAIDLIAEKIGKVLLPIVAKAARWLLKMVEVVTKHWPEIRKVAKQVFAIVGRVISVAAAAVWKGLKDVVTAVKDTVKWFEKHKAVAIALGVALGTLAAGFLAVRAAALITVVIEAVTGAMGALGIAIATATFPISAIVVGVAALAAGLVYAYEKSKTFRDIVNTAFQAVKSVVRTVVRDVVDIFHGLIQQFTGVWQVIKGLCTLNAGLVWKGVINIFKGAFKVIVGLLWNNPITDVFKKVFGGIGTFVGGVFDWIIGKIEWFIGKVGKVVSAVKGAIDAVSSLFGGKHKVGGVVYSPGVSVPRQFTASPATNATSAAASVVARTIHAIQVQNIAAAEHVAPGQPFVIHVMLPDGRVLAETVTHYATKLKAR